MQQAEESVQPRVATLHVEGKTIIVSVLVSYDGVEYVGRLWFNEADSDDDGVPDRGPLSGRSKGEVETSARKLTESELLARYRRALTNKRRYLALRATTNEILRNVRYLNQVAISMRAGLIDPEGAEQEIDFAEHQLHEIVARLREVAGVEANGRGE
ncbi:MAG TPA: hypothetical protein VFK39_10095 [Gemmatimonadaceae bacterium]|nr:hypothetical protein [Gemmatimonadaceae bacterium]